MKKHYFLIVFTCIFFSLIGDAHSQEDTIYMTPGAGIGALEIGQSYEEVQAILGFGKLKSYDDYLAEELFDQKPGSMPECVIGFDYYIKFEYLITLPVEYVYFKDDRINQIKVTSFPEYYRDLSEDVITEAGFQFWEEKDSMQDLYGMPEFIHEYEWYLLKSYFYPEKGIIFNFRDDMFRTAHIIEKTDVDLIEKLKKGL